MPYRPQNAVVWTEIPTRDLEKAIAFYSAALDYKMTIDDSGPNPMANIETRDAKGVSGHLYPGKPATDGNGPTIHLAVPGRLEDTVAEWEKAGGKVLSDPITIPPGRFVYATDPDGNSIGLFEAAQNQAGQ